VGTRNTLGEPALNVWVPRVVDRALKHRDATGSDGGTGQTVVAMAETRLSLSTLAEFAEPPEEKISTDLGISSPALLSPSCDDDDSNAWVVDAGAYDHMTVDPADFSQKSQPRQMCIANANGVLSPVIEAGIVNLPPTLSLTHTMLVPSLSHKLLSVSQVTVALNCVVLIYSDFLFASGYSYQGDHWAWY
jgi:hypothetical protein